MNEHVPDYYSFPIITTVAGLGMLPIPILGILPMIPTLPILLLTEEIIPSVSELLGLEVKTNIVALVPENIVTWIFFGFLLFVLGLVIGFARHMLYERQVSKNVVLAILLLVYFFPILLMQAFNSLI